LSRKIFLGYDLADEQGPNDLKIGINL